MNVIFINPPAAAGVDIVREGRCMQRAGAWTAVWAPISLATAASVIEREGFKCKLIDCIIEGVDLEQLISRVSEFRPSLAVINTATPSIVDDLNVAAELKKVLPAITTLAIGIHVTALPAESLMMQPALDAVVRGEPELTIRDVALALREGRSLAGIQGISYRDSGAVLDNPERMPADLDRLPFPAWHLIERERYLMPFTHKPFLLVGTARGCPFNCKFCADSTYYGKKLRLKSPDKIVRELEWIKTKFHISDFLFWSESFTLKPEWTMQVAQAIIDAKLDVNWVCNSRPDQVDLELLQTIKQAGCWMIGYGLESGSQQMLDNVGKGISLETARDAVHMAKAAGLQVTAHMVLGYPGETEETIQQTIDFACGLPLDFAQFYCAVPFPGSDLYDLAKQEGWINTDDWSRFEQNFSVLDLPGLSAEQVMAWRKKAYLKFYTRPGRLLNIFGRDILRSDVRQISGMLSQFRDWI